MNNLVDWLKQFWFILSALVAGGIAWGQTTMQVSELKEKVTRAEAKADNNNEFKSRIDERTIILQQEMRAQRELLQEILTTQKSIERSVERPPIPTSAPKKK